MVSRAGLRTLSQFHKLARENIVQTQLSRDFLSDIQPFGAPGIDVDLLKNHNISVRFAKKIDDRGQLEAAVDVPIYNSNGTARKGNPLAGRVVLGDDFVRCHNQPNAIASCGNTFLCAKVRSTGSSISAHTS